LHQLLDLSPFPTPPFPTRDEIAHVVVAVRRRRRRVVVQVVPIRRCRRDQPAGAVIGIVAKSIHRIFQPDEQTARVVIFPRGRAFERPAPTSRSSSSPSHPNPTKPPTSPMASPPATTKPSAFTSPIWSTAPPPSRPERNWLPTSWRTQDVPVACHRLKPNRALWPLRPSRKRPPRPTRRRRHPAVSVAKCRAFASPA